MMPQDVAELSVALGGLRIQLAVTHSEDGRRTVGIDVSDPEASVVVGSGPTAAACRPEEAGEDGGSSSVPAPKPSAAKAAAAGVDRRAGIDNLVTKLRTVGEWTAARRGVRAFGLGEADAALLDAAGEGSRVYQRPGEPIPGTSTTCYAVLHDKSGARFLTKSKEEYSKAVKPDGEFIGSTISRGFPTEAEARCYFLGADVDVQWR